ncbi:MAG TPA: hypothetical protein VJ717_03355 [Gemmatimonadaceae bacterium]|nr:hypothetical protein [Gemmatimonadaceae bacterium]
MTSLVRIARRTCAGLAFIAIAQPAAAQPDSDPRWQAWLGCWEPVEASPFTTASSPRVCIIPAGSSAVDIATVIGDSIALRQRVEPTGEQRPVSRDGCTGWERATWSANGQRVYVRSSFTCPGGLTRLSNGVMAMSAGGEWLDVHGVIAGTTKGVRVARYREVVGTSVPSVVGALLQTRVATRHDARLIATAPLTTDDVVEATRFLDPGVVQTWLAERGDGFELGAEQLVALEKQGVPSVVIDVMVALSYPGVFALDRSQVAGATRSDVAAGAGEGRTVYVYGWDPFYSPYGYGYGRYGYGYGYGYGGWYYGNRPVVIVRQPSADNDREHGRVVKGRGYVRGSSGSSDRSGTAASTGQSSGSGSSASGSSGGGSTSKPASSGTGRTAKPRPPK